MNHKIAKYPRTLMIVSMVIFGSIGIFRKEIPLPSAFLAMTRGFIGAIFIFMYMRINHMKFCLDSLKKNKFLILASGVFLGFNWMFLFEAYKYTSISMATITYYMAPIILIIFTLFFLKEKMSINKIINVFVALVGMFLILNITKQGINKSEIVGIFFGLSAAFCYAFLVILNKKMKDISMYDKTIFQLLIAGIVLIPYILLVQKNEISVEAFSLKVIILIIILGVLHTGIAYALYFGVLNRLESHTIANFSYIDPLVAIVLSTFFLKEKLAFQQILGGILILTSSYASSRIKK